VKSPSLILASASPRRADLLRQLAPEFQIVASDAPELAPDHLSPLEICQLNAHRKSRVVAKKIPDAVVLGPIPWSFWSGKSMVNRAISPRHTGC
jgi:septum formation protein